MEPRFWCVVGMVAMQTAGVAAPVTLSNSALALAWDSGDNYALVSVSQGQGRSSFLESVGDVEGRDDSLWILHFRQTDGTICRLTPNNASRSTHTQTGNQLVLNWHGIRSESQPGPISVSVDITLPAASRKSFWSIRVSGTGQAPLWQVDFPRVAGIRALGDDQMCLPYFWGRLLRTPMRASRRRVLAYPQPAAMQFLAYWGTPHTLSPPIESLEGSTSETGWSPDRSNATGLYLAAEDGEAHYKRLARDADGTTMRWWIENIAPVPEWPIGRDQPCTVNYTLPYPIALGAFTGDYHEAAAMYHDWAQQQIWCRRGTVSQWPEQQPKTPEQLVTWTPPWFRNIGFWAKFYHEPAKIIPEWAAYRKWLRVPMASHYYRYHVTRFNDNDPEHLPPDPYLLDGMRDARELGVAPLPYVLATIWDTDTQSWIREHGLPNSMKAESGTFYPWKIGNEVFAWMCPATEQWRAKMRETCRKLIWEHNMAGVYLDVLSAGSAKGCYDPAHGHTVHGGNYQGQGNRRLMVDLRQDIRTLTPDAAFFTEEIDEIFLDVMDGFLTLDLTRSALTPGEQVFPLFTAVYHPYTINFGSDATIAQDPDAFGLIFGQQFIWGSQPLHSDMAPPPPREGHVTSEFFREITQAYYVAGRHFLVGGKWQRIAVRPRNAAAGQCGLELSADRHVVTYQVRRDRKRVWTGPAVLASAWERDGETAITMVNISGKPQSVSLTIRGEKLRLNERHRLSRLWPAEPLINSPASGEHVLLLPPRTVAIHVLTTDPVRARARQGTLDETPWELVTADDGPLPAVTGGAGTLWACSDGPVLNRLTTEKTTASLWRLSPEGKRVPATGFEAPIRGGKAEGRGLPRDLDKKPFALLRRLPFRVDPSGPSDLWCYSAGAGHLSALVPRGTRIHFAKPGLVVLTNAQTGELVVGLDHPLVAHIETPADTDCLLGYATFDPAERRTLPSPSGGPAAVEVQRFLDAAWALPGKPADLRTDRLAKLSAQFAQLARSATSVPGLLSPGATTDRVHDRIRALLTAFLGCTDSVTAGHRWLACGTPKPVTYHLTPGPATVTDISRLEVTAIGEWEKGDVSLRRGSPAPAPPSGRLSCDITLLLRDGLYVERTVPLLEQLPVQKNGRTFQMCRVFHLEANRPYELTPVNDTVTAVAGRPVDAGLRIRNWSPDPVDITLSGTPPARDWSLAFAATSVSAPALQNTDTALTITPPVDARAGEYTARFTGTHSPVPNAETFARITVALVDSMGPLQQPMPGWTPPRDEARSRIRHEGTLAFHVTEGQPIDLGLTNLRVSVYVTTLEYRLLDPDLRPVKSGRVPVDKSVSINLPAQKTGAHFLEVRPKTGSVRVAVRHQAMAELATSRKPVNLFNDPVTRWFFVPPEARSFRFGARDGGPSEPAHFIFTSPANRVAYDVSTNFAGAEVEIQVLPEEAGGLWRVDVDPIQDISFWLAGDACPYLSTAPERVLVPARFRAVKTTVKGK